jgi:hypothetical protein
VKWEESGKKLPWEQEVAGSNPAAPTMLFEIFKHNYEYKKAPAINVAGAFLYPVRFIFLLESILCAQGQKENGLFVFYGYR